MISGSSLLGTCQNIKLIFWAWRELKSLECAASYTLYQPWPKPTFEYCFIFMQKSGANLGA